MPYWCNLAELSDFEICYEEFEVRREDLSASEKRVMHERYTLIAGIIPFVSDEKLRSMMISKISEQYSFSKQTIRKYLCLYLVYQDNIRARQAQGIAAAKANNLNSADLKWKSLMIGMLS